MKVIRFALQILLLGLCLLSVHAFAKTLPLADTLISLTSEQGEQLLLDSEARQAYWPLSVQFVTQKNKAYCGIASIVMVLNALGVEAPSTPEFEPYNTFTQDNVLNDETEKVLPQAVLMRQGMTLDQIGRLLDVHSVKAEVHHAAESNADEFRQMAREYLDQKDHYVIVNYLRSAIGQERGGHISPLAAYDADTDRFLILDVSRYKYPPVWVATEELFAAMNTITDPDNDNKTGGFVLISAGR
jgi:glutathione-S-conjugate glycine hydrolase